MRDDDCPDCVGCGYHCSCCRMPGVYCECDDVERGGAEEWDCEMCSGTGIWFEPEEDDA